MKLFEITTRRIRYYHVLASDYASAIAKAEEFLSAGGVVGMDGSLQINNNDDDAIISVRLLNDSVIK